MAASRGPRTRLRLRGAQRARAAWPASAPDAAGLVPGRALAPLLARPGADAWGRALDPGRFCAPGPVTGQAVLLLDDTWTSGGTAQSAAVALKRAGARSVAVVVAGRHLPAITGCAGVPGTAGQAPGIVRGVPGACQSTGERAPRAAGQ